MPPTTVAIGSDHAGYHLKELLKADIEARGIAVVDVGAHSTDSVDYPDYAKLVCAEVGKDDAGGTLGLLVCGTGIGMSMTANKVPGIRAAVCANGYQCRMSRKHNNANVLCIGERVTGPGVAANILDIFLTTDFEGGRHQRRVDKFEDAVPTNC